MCFLLNFPNIFRSIRTQKIKEENTYVALQMSTACAILHVGTKLKVYPDLQKKCSIKYIHTPDTVHPPSLYQVPSLPQFNKGGLP